MVTVNPGGFAACIRGKVPEEEYLHGKRSRPMRTAFFCDVPHVLLKGTLMSSCTSPRERKFPFPVRRGSVEVKIYRTPSHGCDRYTVSYYQDRQRKRPSFSTFEEAKNEADAVVGRLAGTDADVLVLKSADRAAYQRARQLLDPYGVAIETAAAQFSHAKERWATCRFLKRWSSI